MALSNLDDDDIQDELDLGDYNVIPRPQELIDLQKRTSGSKPEVQEKYGHGVSKKTLGVKEAVFKRLAKNKESVKAKEKPKEKKLCNKHERKGSSKSKLPYKLPMNSNSPKKKYASNELENKFETFVKSAMSSVSKLKSEASKTAGNESADQSGYKDVQKIMIEPAVTPQRRFQVLDARDNIMRSSESKQFGSKKAKVLGCCPDMCPEKERYHRIAKNCLSPLELKFALDQNLSREDCHRFMIKEYSRSSADQQEPLPHELRPISVLKFTMDYLICNVLDISLDTVTLADWYDFIWNRTRSIRKDITQQQLCDVASVDIIEKCVRFHIHCAEALSEEDTSIFDPKINNENLTKGLQTLKHMYHDLQSRGIQCPNEAEFRSYDILLSLTEGETLRLVKDIRKDLLKSSKVRSAFEAALAFKSNNYVKFFKIIEKADYLSSCILHRYISEARIRALQVIVRAYSTQNNATMYPTPTLLQDLKFESLSEACEFCKCHGLDSNEDYITIQRQQFTNSPSGLPICRSSLLVGNKTRKSLGEVINNADLPANPLGWYKPHDSFDERNTLKTYSLGTAAKEGEPAVQVMDTFEDMETDEASTDRYGTVCHMPETAAAPQEKSADFESADIHELEKRRTKLISEISKLQSYNTKNLKDIKSLAEKVLLKNKKDFNPPSVSKPHKSIMFSSEDSQPRQRENISVNDAVSSGDIAPSGRSSAKTVAVSSFQSVKTSEITTKEPFFKTSIATSSVFSPLATCSSLTNCQPSVFSQGSIPVSTKLTSIFEVTRDSDTSIFGGVKKDKNMTIIGEGKRDNNTSVFGKANRDSNTSVFDKAIRDSNISVFREARKDSNASVFRKAKYDSYTSSFDKAATDRYTDVFGELKRDKKTVFDEINSNNNQKFLPSPVVSEFGMNENVLRNESSVDHVQKSPLPVSKGAQFSFIVQPPLNKKSSESSEWAEVPEVEEIHTSQKNFHSYDIRSYTEREPGGEPAVSSFDTVDREDEGFDDEFSDEMRQQQREEELTKCAEDIADELYTECVQEYSVSICEEVFNNEKIKKAQQDDEFAMIRRNLAQKAILKWKYFCERKRQRKLYEESTLCSPWQPMLLNTPYARTGVVNPMLAYKKQCILSRRTDEKIKQMRAIPPGWEEFKPEEIWKKVQPYPSAYFGKSGISNFLKLCIIFPAESDDFDFSIFMDWICTKFSLPRTEEFSLNTENTFSLNDGKTVVTVRAIQLDPSRSNVSSKCLNGITSMILCVPHFSNSLGDVLFCQRLLSLLCDCSVSYSYPLFVFHCGSSQNSEKFLTLLNEKFGSGYFPDIKTKYLSEVKSFSKNSSELLEGINWLMEKKSTPPLLKSCEFGYYVEKCIAFAFNSLYWKSSLDGYKGLIMMPKQIIAFYNNVMTFRADILCSDLLISVSLCWPPEELIRLYPDLKIIDEKMQYKFQESMKNMLLPSFEGNAFNTEDVWDYVESIDALAGKCSDRDSLYVKIKEVLGISHWRDINWLQIIEICAFHLVSSQSLELLDSDEELQVYYTEEDIDTFEEETFWKNVLTDIKKSLTIGIKRKEHTTYESPQKKKRTDQVIEMAPAVTMPVTEQKGISNAFDVPDIFSYQREKIFGRVEAAVAAQIQQTESFLHLLNESIISGNIQDKDNEIENNSPPVMELSNHDVFSSNTDVHTYKNSTQIDGNLGTHFKTGVDWLDSTLPNKSSHDKSILSIADKISELKYNIQKCNILEDHFSQLLSKQV